METQNKEGAKKRQKEIRTHLFKDEHHQMLVLHAEEIGLNISQLTRHVLMTYMRNEGLLPDITTLSTPQPTLVTTHKEKKQVA